MRALVVALAGALYVVSWAPGCTRSETVTGTAAVTGTVTVTGTVVDLYCYNPVTKANSGMDHGDDRECAWACAKWEAQPVGLVAADGKLYQLAGGLVADNNAKIAPHVSHAVTITGDVAEKDGVSILTANDLEMVSGSER